MTRQSRPRPITLAGGLLVAGLIVVQWRCMGPAILGLNAGLAIAYLFWIFNPAIRSDTAASLVPLYLAAIGLQVLHFAEEVTTGFQTEFPQLFGYTWRDSQFVEFNVLWLCGFALSAIGLARHRPLALLVVWFFALAGGLGNGVFHIAMALLRGGYFPGLVTAPLMLVAGVLLLRRLVEPSAQRGVA